MDLGGQTTVLRPEVARWTGVSLSPDGRRLALSIYDGVQWDVWIYDWEPDQLSRLTFDPALDHRPIWTPDGERIVFQSDRDGLANIYWKRADGSGDVERLRESENRQQPHAWHPDGDFVIYTEFTAEKSSCSCSISSKSSSGFCRRNNYARRVRASATSGSSQSASPRCSRNASRYSLPAYSSPSSIFSNPNWKRART